MRFSLLMRVGAALWLGGTLLFAPPRVHAYSDAQTYAGEVTGGGGGGRWFTGSPAEGYSCSVCHTSAPGQTVAFSVEGLPDKGYAPGTVYSIRLAWPEFAARAQVLQQAAAADPNAPTPGMSLLAEFVAENGTASGTITLDPKTITTGEQCVIPMGRRAASVYHVKPAEVLSDTATRMSPCDANDLGTRCIVTVQSCGAQEARFYWTAPPSWQGPIWFSAGFVATEMSSGDPKNDAVQEISKPLMPATSGAQEYESVLSGGCSVSRAPARSRLVELGCVLFGLWLLARMRARARIGRTRSSRAAALALLGLFGTTASSACSETHDQPVYPAVGPNTGLYTPGSQIGVVKVTKDAGTDAGKLALGDRCAGAAGDGMMGDEGELDIEFTSLQLFQRWTPRNVGAVWIEADDDSHTYIKTLSYWALDRAMSLFWLDHICMLPEVDVMTTATLPNHNNPHSTFWKSRDFRRKLAPDGKYVLNIEVTEVEFGGMIQSIPFDKGPEGFMMTPPDTKYYKGLKLTYHPNAGTAGAGGAGGASGTSGAAGAAGTLAAGGSAAAGNGGTGSAGRAGAAGASGFGGTTPGTGMP